MACKKRAFKDKNHAVKALHIIKNKKDGRKKPQRAYQCEDCLQWHLTSQAINEPINTNYQVKLDWSKIICNLT